MARFADLAKKFDIVLLDEGMFFPHVRLRALSSRGKEALGTGCTVYVCRQTAEQVLDLCHAIGVRCMAIVDEKYENTIR